MIVNLDEMKGYLRVDFDDDDALIENFITTGQNLCADMLFLKPLQSTPVLLQGYWLRQSA